MSVDSFKSLLGHGRGSLLRALSPAQFTNEYRLPVRSTTAEGPSFQRAIGRAATVLHQMRYPCAPNLTKNLSANQIFVFCAVTPWYKYSIEFDPMITSRTTRFILIDELSKAANGFPKLYDGQFMYVPYQLAREFFHFDGSNSMPTCDIQAQFIENIEIQEIPLNLINDLFSRGIELGRQSIFNSMNRQNTSRMKVRCWNGKISKIERHEDGLLLTIEFPSRITTTCYEELERFYGSTNYQENARKTLINKLVLTRYDNRTQRIDDIDFQLTPATFKSKHDPKKTLVDYYLSRFDIIIQDPDQPLLVYYPRRTAEPMVEKQYLVPELCYLTGLYDRTHRDARARKTNKSYRFDSIGRQAELAFFDNVLQRNPATLQYMRSWGINLVLNTPIRSFSINNPSSSRILTENSSDSEQETDEREQNNRMDSDYSYLRFAKPIPLTCWLLIYAKIDAKRAVVYVNTLRQVGQQNGMPIEEPIHVQIDDDEPETCAQALRSHLRKDIQLVSIIVKSRRIDRYNTIKRICCVEIPTPSEIVLRSTIADDDALPSIALNIARDINFKLGGEIRLNHMNLPNTMFIGLSTWSKYDLSYESLEHLDYVLSIVGSINYQMTEYFSLAKSYRNRDELKSDIASLVRLAVQAYYQNNKIYPSTIIIGRNISSSIDDLKWVKDLEIQAIIDELTDRKLMGDYKPRLILFAYMKQMIHDFYDYVQPKKIVNVDCLTAKDSASYLFYLSSHRDQRSSLQARQILILFDNTDLSAKKVQRLILYLTYHIPQRSSLFFPSICRFAQRLASLVGETLTVPPKYDQQKNLFYL